MAKLTLSPITSLTNEQSVINTINANWDAIEAALELTYTRTGTGPNVLTTDLDMNGYKIINLGAPTDDLDVARLTDMVDGVVGDTGATGPAGSVADGDKGDIVVSASGATWTIDSGVLTTAARTLTDDVTIADMHTTLGLGTAAVADIGTGSGDVASATDPRWYAYTITLQDASFTFTIPTGPTIWYHASATPHTYTIDPIASTEYPTGTQLMVYNGAGTGAVTIAGGTGVAIYTNGATSSGSSTVSSGGMATYIHLGNDIWFGAGPGVA